jgi:Tfp pilus assembly protein PilF
MRNWTVALCALLLAACATVPGPEVADGLFNDRLFLAPSERISAEDVFALSEEMKRYVSVDIAAQLRSKGARQGLVEALRKSGELKLDYDSVMTRNAAQAFAARSGNCLSLVIMTAAFAKQLDLPVTYQSVLSSDTVSRSGNIQFFVGHVNLTLGERPKTLILSRSRDDVMTIDFLPPQEAQALSTHVVDEASIVAMYMNNRAAEALARGQVDDAYWWARAAIGHERRFVSAYNTLGVVYHRHGNLAEAETVFTYALAREPGNIHVMSNLVRLLDQMGRTVEATALAAKLHRLDPRPAFSDFDRGMEALRDGHPATAKDLFAREVERDPHYHEFRFWLGVAYLGLGDVGLAQQQLALAREYATTPKERDLYSAKLDRIRSGHLQ